MCHLSIPCFRWGLPTICLAFGLGVGPLAWSQTPIRRVLSLPDAVSGAIAQSKAAKINAARQGAALANVEQARNAALPGLTLNASYIRISDNITPFSVSFPGAGEVVLNPQILNQSYNSVQVRQLLWGGGRVRYGVLAAGREAAATVAEAARDKLAAADNATSIWYNLYLLNVSERIIRQNVSLLQERRRDLTNLEKQGLVLKNDGLKLDLAVSNLEASLIDIGAGRSISNFNMAMALADPTETEYAIDTTALTTTDDPTPLADYLTEAGRNRIELTALGLRQEAALIGQKALIANRLPTLSAGGSYDYNRPNQRVFPNRADFTGTWNVGVFLSFDLLGAYTNKARETQTRYDLEQLTTGIDQLQDGIRMEVNAAYRGYRQARDKIGVAQKAIEQAAENFRVEQNRLRAATTTPTDFLDANTQLVQARLNLETARANAELAHWKLLKSVGRL
jgi:outer membrane protein